jgi:hypothetical protein
MSKITKIKEFCKETVRLADNATNGPWFGSYCGIFTSNIERNSKDDVTENGTYPVGDFMYRVGDVEVLGGDTPTIEGAQNSHFICYSRTFSPLAAQSLLILIEYLEDASNHYNAPEGQRAIAALKSIENLWPVEIGH